MLDHTTTSRRQFLQLSAGAGLVALAAACTGAPSPTAAPPQSQPAATAPASKPALTKVTVVSSAGILDNANWMVGKQMGFFEEFGVDFDYIGVAGGRAMLDALLGKSADLVDSSPDTALASIEQGAEIKILAGSRPGLNYAFYARKEIPTLKDLEGKVIGAGPPGAFQQNVSLALFAKKGIDASKVEFVNVGTSTDVYKAMTAGKVVAGVSGVTFLPSADADGLHVLSELWKDLPDYLTWSFFSSIPVLQEKSDALARTLAGYAKTYRYVKTPESKDLFMKIGTEELKATPPQVEAYWSFLKNDGVLATNLELSPAQIEYMQQLNITAGKTQTRVVPYEQVVDLSVRDKALELAGKV